MNMRIGSTDEATIGWGTHAAWVHLRKDSQQLATDTFAGAEKRVILADKAAVIESRVQVAQARGIHRVDVTV
jgi:hypothetical protein